MLQKYEIIMENFQMKYETKRGKKRCYLIFNPNEYVMSDTLPYPRRNIAYEHNIFAP